MAIDKQENGGVLTFRRPSVGGDYVVTVEPVKDYEIEDGVLYAQSEHDDIFVLSPSSNWVIEPPENK